MSVFVGGEITAVEQQIRIAGQRTAPTDEIARIIMSGGNATDIADQAAKDGVWDLRRAALEKVKNGITSLTEVNRVTVD